MFPIWNREHIERVDIVVDETVALEGRARYYDRAGALRDMVQNHLLQLLCLVAMEERGRLDATEFRDAKVRLLESVRIPTPDSVARDTVRARYSAGRIGSRDVPDYVTEEGVDPGRDAETFCALTLFVDNDRFRGVPFRLRTGKALAADRRFLAVTFRPVDHSVFEFPCGQVRNRFTFATGPPDRLALDIMLNGAGDAFSLEPARLDVELAAQDLSPYARLLLDAFEGNPVLAIRGDETELCWRIVEPILASWAEGQPPMWTYPAGSEGPEDA
jgi:glucose-6-phosphate 1-dehydrogenase